MGTAADGRTVRGSTRSNDVWATVGQGREVTVEETLLVSLAQVRAGDVARVGAKAANLGEMMRAGIPVPRGFCITTAAFRRHAAAAGGAPALAELVLAAPGEALDRAGDTLRTLLVSAPIPVDLEHAILSAWEQLLDRTACAVRSSATAEDLPRASFAGQLDTVLNVSGSDALLQAIRHCWASLFSGRALAYRTHHGLGHEHVSMAVVVQELVPADAAGVLFTLNPLSGRADEILVEASYGLGEAVVSGRVTPDRFVLHKSSLRVVERTLSEKMLALVPAASGGVCEQPLAADVASTAAVADPVIQRVAELGLQAERLFGGPQDLEWAVARGEVFVLQSRPITTHAQSPSADDHQVWTNMNVGEVLPDVISPLTRSFLERTVIRCFEDLLAELGFDLHDAPLVGFVAGRLYFNLNTVVAITRAFPGGRNADVTSGFGGMHAGPEAPAAMAVLEDNLPRIQLSRVQLLRRVPRWLVWWQRHMSTAKAERVRAAFAHQLDERRDLDFDTQSDASLMREIDSVVELFRTGLVTLGGYAIVGMGDVASFDRLSARWFPSEPIMVNQLLTGLGGMASADAGLDMWRLATLAHRDRAVEDVVLPADRFDLVRARLAGLDSGAAFLARWEEFMARHGHHARGEIELMNARWADDPDYVLGQVQAYLRNIDGKDPVAVHRNQTEVGMQRAEGIRRQLTNPIRRAVFNFTLRRAQHGILYRENVKSEAVRLVALVRRVALEIGQRLAVRGVIECPDDIFFLHLDELRGAIDEAGGTSRGRPRALVTERRAAFERDRSVVPPPVIVGRFNAATVAPEVVDASCDRLTGYGVSPGVVTGPARVILRADTDERVLPGEILVAPFTDPGWTPYFQLAAGLVTDLGGLLSHGSIVAREYGLPAVVNVRNATRVIHTGDRVQVDGTRGEVRILR